MKRSYYIIALITILLTMFSCVEKLIPSKSTGKAGVSYDEATFNYLYIEAIKQKLMGNDGEALNRLEQCIKINPESDAAYYQMAQIVTARGDTKNGKNYAYKALEIDPYNLWYLIMMAGIYYQEKNLDSAIIFYQKAVKTFPGKENLLLNLGNLYSENKNYDKAREIFDELDKKYGVNQTSTLSSVKNLMAAGKYDDAIIKAKILIAEYPEEILYNGILAEIYRRKGENNKAIEIYKQLIDKNPENPQVELSFCDFLIEEKNYDGLFILIDKIVLNENISRDEKASLVSRVIEMPDVTEIKGDSLMFIISELESIYKNDGIIVLLRPELYIKEKRLNDAATRLEEIIKNTPENYYAWEKLLLTYLQEKDYVKLMNKGEECAKRFNRSFLAKILYANGALENGKYEIALDELSKAEILAGENKEFTIQVLTMRADVYYRMKNYTTAFKTFEDALKIDKNDLTLINNYAYYLAEQNLKLKEAESMAKEVIEKEKNNTSFLDTYGWVLYKRGKLKDAAKIMESVINSGEEPDAVWYEHYGYILKGQNKCSKAVENWNIALKIDSTKTELKNEIKRCTK